jgi:hypothetical protein
VLKSEAVPDTNERKYRGMGAAVPAALLEEDQVAAVGTPSFNPTTFRALTPLGGAGRFAIGPVPVVEEVPAGGKKPAAKPPAAKPPPKGTHPLLFPEQGPAGAARAVSSPWTDVVVWGAADEEPHPYQAAGTYVRIEFGTARPLVPAKRQPRIVRQTVGFSLTGC